jgi:hypothetical protein
MKFSEIYEQYMYESECLLVESEVISLITEGKFLDIVTKVADSIGRIVGLAPSDEKLKRDALEHFKKSKEYALKGDNKNTVDELNLAINVISKIKNAKVKSELAALTFVRRYDPAERKTTSVSIRNTAPHAVEKTFIDKRNEKKAIKD